MARICFLNPFGTDSYDELIGSTLRPALHGSTEVEIRHLAHAPRNIDYYAPKHLAETEIMTAAVEAEREGFDAFVIGCCYDPALTQCRELVEHPGRRPAGGVGAAVAAVRPLASPCVTDHRKAVPELRDRVRLYGLEGNCRAVDAIDWFVDDMVLDPMTVAKDTYVKVAGRDADHRRRDGRHRLHDRVGLLRAGRPAGRRRARRAVGRQPQRDGGQAGRDVRRPATPPSQYRISRTGYYQQHARPRAGARRPRSSALPRPVATAMGTRHGEPRHDRRSSSSVAVWSARPPPTSPPARGMHVTLLEQEHDRLRRVGPQPGLRLAALPQPRLGARDLARRPRGSTTSCCATCPSRSSSAPRAG